MSKKYSILVIDDEIEILDMLSRFLNRNPNFSVQTFSNPVSALSSINNNTKYDLVLLDIMMPQMNGLDVLEKLKEINSDQKVIMMTAYSTLDKVLKSHKIGATNYVMKPFSSLDSLEKKVIEVLEA
ncbi:MULTISPECIES: response regulator [Aliarcobacter]|jgi:DNA-binding NtrC family response regulator|uniref:Response regulator n=6 Tax=Arcobacteraceae TaxID=2808963 RepID=A0AAU0P3P4_9BACT|nr:response regulator [Aliarcobacter cryaerophilus]OQA74212.1 MAG: Sporulation initiation phosphotransferase F [Candidatus Dependentiae bacterium ADurb.Bin246]WNL13096.1 response regulator [Arcobacter sp. AZ-2023]WPD02461.1 response regulator [Arcobacter sp. DSM 115972]WPD06540.1 response regulator [Arcobacter sp. DSM 115956]WPD08631.1 response regulator [Arcobacter sp. DSM 115955]WPD09580.1 response regulator [Arcobacter sp. DSM 115954]WPD11571.1 response regulator [Arcobacter sp. DSM 11596